MHSTLTQQVAKLLLAIHDEEASFHDDRNLVRGVREVLLTRRLEDELTKEQVLEVYLNGICLGRGAYGVADASASYFHKKLSELTLAEMASLAAIPNDPGRYSPSGDVSAARERRRYILGRMLVRGDITRAVHDAAAEEDVIVHDDRHRIRSE